MQQKAHYAGGRLAVGFPLIVVVLIFRKNNDAIHTFVQAYRRQFLGTNLLNSFQHCGARRNA
ncbi:MAG: hypothetical protein H6577_10910 [Lewinellaceae bacterium]|nr:hypothetical protein [Saprospiraceae bacterium]MCB9338623.1 hypothetical protein [Lewinellaceae bacterium]